MCFGLGGGLGFLYAEQPDEAPPLYLVGRTEALEEDFAASLGIDLDVRSTDDPAEGLAWIEEELAAGRRPLVWSDIAELEYLRVRMTNTRHAIVVAGIDHEHGIAWIADNDRAELQPCTLASLAAARASRGFPGPNRHRLFAYDWPDALGEPRHAAVIAIRRAVQNMRDGGRRLGGMEGFAGLDGVYALAGRYPGWPAAYGDRLGDALQALSVFVVKAGTGGAMFRSLYAEFLHDMAELLGDHQLARAERGADDLARAWSVLGRVARSGDHATGVPVLEEIARSEGRLVDSLARWLDNPG